MPSQPQAEYCRGRMDDITEYRCPNCDTAISERAITCPACRFPLEDYQENQKTVKYVHMERSPSDVEAIRKEVLRIAKMQKAARGSAGCLTGIALIVAGFFIMFVPIFGLIVGPTTMLFGLVSGYVTGLGQELPRVAVFFGKLFNTITYRKDVVTAQRNLANRYLNAVCPFCQTKYLDLTFSNPLDGYFDCQKCHNRLLRKKDYLFYLPKPKAVINNDPIKAFIR